MQFILIEPDVKRVSWGVVKFCDLMQDVEVSNDKEDSRSLLITIHKPVNNIYVKTSPPILNAKFTFDDHTRCMTAKQNLIRGRQRYVVDRAILSLCHSIFIVHSARLIRSATIVSILEVEVEATHAPHSPSGTATTASAYFTSQSSGRDLNLTIVRNCPVKNS
jgi:CLEC16A C-terminal